MPDTQSPVDGDGDVSDHEEVLGRVDSLLARLRPAASAPLRPPAPSLPVSDPGPAVQAPGLRSSPAAGEIPLLTDVVSLGPVGARPPVPPAAEPAGLDAPLHDVDELEQEVYRRLGDRLDHEIGALLERRVMPELAGSLDLALAQVATEIKGSIRQLVRETIEETLHQQVRNLRLPLDDAERTDPGSDLSGR